MDPKRETKLSRFLSYVLRHRPEEIGLQLTDAGWVEVETLLAALAGGKHAMSPAELREIVASCEKQRYAFSEDGLSIRASQGHSVAVKLDYEAQRPPETLYHGTVSRNLASIKESGLLKGERHHVHLSERVDVADDVGQRRGRPVILVVHASMMAVGGHEFFRSANGVWLTEQVPAKFITFPED